MTSNGRRARAALSSIAVALALSAAAAPVRAQQKPATAEELKAARELFQEAYKDEQEKRYAQALEKFQKVASVKESGSVRYRIASVLEALGRLREARDAFRAIAAAKASLPDKEQEIADSSAERAHALDKKIPKISLQLQERSPADARVLIDGAPVPASTTARLIELDPGEHVVRGTSPTTQPHETKVNLAEGAQVSVVVVLEPLDSAKPPPPPPPPPVPEAPRRDNTLAYIALGAGGALLVTGIILLAVRESDISDLNKECNNEGVCPIGKMQTLQSEHDQAELFGPLGVGVGVVGLAGIGLGSYLLFRPAPANGPPANGTTTSTPSSARAALRLTPRPVAGGAVLGVAASF